MLDYYREKEQENRAVTTLSESTKHLEPPVEQYSGGWFDSDLAPNQRKIKTSII